MIVGIDEVGRGAWAGPLCIAAVALGVVEIDGLTDSKKLSKKKREAFSRRIQQDAPLVGIGWVSAAMIDKIGMTAALKLAASRAYTQIDCADVTQIIIDGTIMLIDDPRATTMKQADLLVPSVSAASIIAKVARDRYMECMDTVLPGYSFAAHVGYGTAIHQAAISSHGSSPIHRMSFAPMKNDTKMEIQSIKPTSTGTVAEDKAAEYLERIGFTIIERNWKTKWCEIDVIASKAATVHFVEVKYRKQANWGSGTDAITRTKLRQMRFAAELWLSSHQPTDAVLSSLSLHGPQYDVDEFIEVIL